MAPYRSHDADNRVERATTDRAYKRAGRLLLATLCVYALLVATHDGEFWPFSIYQMFSSAGRPWTRVMIRELASLPSSEVRWRLEGLATLPGHPFAMDEQDVPQNDVVAYVARTTRWTKAAGDRLRVLLGYDRSAARILAVYRIDGSQADDGSVAVRCTPVLYLASDTLIAHPNPVIDDPIRPQ